MIAKKETHVRVQPIAKGDGSEDRLLLALEEYSTSVEAGQPLSRESILAKYSDVAVELSNCLDSLEFIREVAPQLGDDAATGSSAVSKIHARATIGDFLILRELGRGGMGVVYEAEQLSLGRRVALKVLPFAAMLDKQQLARFKNEARAAATLDHPNIVAIYSVGSERGVHYYAMQLIEGQSLAEIIAELKPGRPPSHDESAQAAAVINHATAADTAKAALPTVRATGSAAFSTIPPFASCEYFCTIARLGIQAAEALDHAHQNGILHRDIKPANLLVDDTGKLWITDFGLARIEKDAGMTMTGDLLGTLRYMSPEQALANRVVVDHRSDIYSLGVTLYEILTLRPAFASDDRQKLLRQIAFDEPRSPRQLNSHIPHDLETIILKSIEKNPADRYLTARLFADDLQRFIAHEPIKARPATAVQRLRKWSQRHVGVVWSALAVALLTIIILGASASLIAQSRNEADQQRLSAIEEKDKATEDRNVAMQERNKARLNQYYAEIVSGQTDWDHKNASGLRSKLMAHLPAPNESDNRRWEWFYLLSLSHPEVRTIQYDFHLVHAACSPDGNYIRAAGQIWKSDSGERVRSYDPSLTLAKRAAWSFDGQKFAWGKASDDNAFYVWDRATDTVNRFAGHKGSVWCIDRSPDGKQIASGSIDHAVKIWDGATKSVLRTLPALGNAMNVAWSPDAKLLAAGMAHSKKGIKVWTPSTGEVVADLPGTGPHSVSWHPDGKVLAVAGDNRWYLLNREDWSVKIEHPLSRGGEAIACSPDGKLIAVAHGEAVTIWDAGGKEPVGELNGHKTSVMSASWAKDSRHLVTSSNDGEIKLWDLKSQFQPAPITWDSPVDSLAWLADNKTLVAVSQQKRLIIAWNTTDGTLKKQEIAVEKPLCLSDSRRYAAKLLDDQHAIAILDTENGKTKSVLRLPPDRTLRSCKFSPDDSKLVTASVHDTKRFLDFWNVDTERRISSWGMEGAPRVSLRGITWANDGSRVAFVGPGDLGDDGTLYGADHLHVVNVGDGKRALKHLVTGELGGGISCLAWSPDGKSVAIGTLQGRVEVVELEYGRALFSTKVHDGGVHAIAWHSDGNRLACGTNDGGVRLIASSDGQPLLTFSLADKSETMVAWSADGKRLAAATKGGSAQVWDASRGYEFTTEGRQRGQLAWEYYNRGTNTSGQTSTLDLQTMLALAPDTMDFWFVRGQAFARVGRFGRAAEEFSKLVSPNPRYSFGVTIDQALCLLASGDVNRFRDACGSFVARFRDSEVPSNKGHVAFLCALTRNAIVDSTEVLSFAEAKRSPDGDIDNVALLTIGACLVRDRQFDKAVSILTSLATKLDAGGDSTDRYELACSQFFLALARHELGQDYQARRLQALANQTSDEHHQLSSRWQEKVILDALRREVETKLGKCDGG